MNEHPDDRQPSKSARKRAMNELQHLGEQLLVFTDDELQHLGIPDRLLDAITTVRHINAHGARRRQFQYIGKLMRDIDITAVTAALEKRQHQDAMQTQAFHLVEELRNRLVHEGDAALAAVLAHFPAAERQHLRKLAKQAHNEQETGQPPRAAKRLFRYLRELQDALDGAAATREE